MTDEPKPKPKPKAPRPGVNPFGGGYSQPPASRRPKRPQNAKERAARQLNAPAEDIARMDDDDLQGITPRDAARLLGEESYADKRDKKRLRTRWRFEQLRRFRTDEGRRRLVALLERSLTGDELEISEEIEEAIGNLLAIDREKKPDVPQLIGIDDRSDTAKAYARYRNEGSGR
ncbi:hypothetical protein [Lentzea albida]|uniref:Uncharacterized protein n=1 Tax=Lentzea albida TaxID=65499 RepID=A0A1H9VI14_9PSEU|nr:hypothetical protein [Lentzea albida]SES21219.1 hypothetical protein SAMN04488000_118134 [Lentzea albida]